MDESLEGQLLSAEKSILLNWLKRFGSRFKTGFIITDPARKENPFVFINHSFTEITGYDSEEVIGRSIRFLFGEGTDITLARKIAKSLYGAQPVNTEIVHYKKDGTPFWNELVIQPLVNHEEEILFNIAFIRDVTYQKKDEMLLKLQEKILTDINQGIKFEELMHNVFGVAESFLLTGAACLSAFKDKAGKWSVQANESLPKVFSKTMLANIKKDGQSILEKDLLVVEMPRVTEHDYEMSWSVPMFDGKGELHGVFTVFMKSLDNPTDIQRRFLEKIVPLLQLTKTFFDQQQQYLDLAFSDVGTGLPNSHAFLRKLKTDIENGRNGLVAIIEPSEYLKIIDLYGRVAADEFFIQLARRIEKEGIEGQNFIARFSSSTLIVTNETIERDAGDSFILKLRKVISEPFIIAGENMFLTLKTGIVLPTAENKSAEEIIRRADVALTDANRRPGNSTSYYLDLQNEKMVQDMAIYNELTKALVAGEIDVHLQPKVNLENGEIIAFEALARWYSPVLGQVPPNIFITVAENIGKIIELETSILEKVMQWQGKRIIAGARVYQVAVNISVDHFFHSTFMQTLIGFCDQYNVATKHIRLEIIESIGLVDFERAKLIFKKLRDAGFDVSIDDFGVGYSSLSYLSQLNVNELKIDRSFILALDEPDTRAVVQTIIQLANNLNLSTVAEGIEEHRHVDMLLSLGCEIGQGFYYYKPMMLSDIDLLLEQN